MFANQQWCVRYLLDYLPNEKPWRGDQISHELDCWKVGELELFEVSNRGQNL